MILVFIMAVLSRMSGGGLVPKWLPSFVPEIVFGLVFAACAWFQHGWVWALVAFLLAWRGIELGHGTAYTMGRNPSLAQSGRKQFLSFFVDPICKHFNKPYGGVFYSWLFMGIKGLVIGLATLSFAGLFLAVLWPLAYEIGWKLQEKFPKIRQYIFATSTGEYLSGAFAGAILYMVI